MATVRARAVSADTDYPTSDGKPMAETDRHRDVMTRTIGTLQARYARSRKVYVSGNLLLYYEEGNRRKHVSPDVFVVKGIAKHRRRFYLLWREGKGPDVAFEITSASTSQEDLRDKLELYRDVLKIQEYFLFDPYEEYLKPSLMGYRLQEGAYVRIAEVKGRLPSEVLGLHLERDGEDLRLFDPATGQRLPTPEEEAAQSRANRQKAEKTVRALKRSEAARHKAEVENEQLRRELEALRRRPSKE